MKTLLKITLVAGIAVSAINIPDSSAEAGLFSGLRGMFSPQSDLSEFEGNFVQPQGQAWQQAPIQTPAQYAQSSYESASSYVPSSAATRTAEPGVRYFTAEEYYGRTASAGLAGQTVKAPKKNRWGFGKGWGLGKGLAYGNVYDYESGSCGNKCAATAPIVQRYVPSQSYTYAPVRQQSYRQITQYRCWDGEIVATQGGCKPQTKTVSIPQFRCWDGEIVTDENGCKRQTITREVVRTVDSTPTFSNSSTSAWTGAGTPTNCPAGTSAQSDGSCLEISTSSSSFSSGSSSYGSGSSFSSSSSGFATNCPSGTSAQSDGTCLELGSATSSFDSSSSFSSSSSSFNSGSSFSGGFPNNCPSGTSAQSDGTCLESGSSGFNQFTGSSVELFPSNPVPSTPSYGSDSNYEPVYSSDFLPLRK